MEDYTTYYILFSVLATIGGIIWYLITTMVVRAPGAVLNKKFVSLGTLSGKSYDEIAYVVGQPNAVSSVGNGQVLRQWQATGYHIALVFDENDICLGISSEVNV